MSEVVRRSNELSVEVRDDEGESIIMGVGAVVYDGTPRTEFVLRDGGNGKRRVVERVLPGAFDDVLAKNPDVRVMRNHDSNHLLGRTKAGTARVWKGNQGDLLYLAKRGETQAWKDTAEMLKRGDISGSSFMFTIREEAIVEKEDILVYEIRSVDKLLETGPVTFPAYHGTSAGLRVNDPSDVLRRVDAWEAEQAEKKAESEKAAKDKIADDNAILEARAKLAGI